MTKLCSRKTEIGGALLLLIMTGVALAQDAPSSPAMETRLVTHVSPTQTAPANPASKPSSLDSLKVSFAGGQLTIDALNSTLADILTKVAALTGAKIKIPEGATTERLAVIKLGPGPARQVLASLLYGSDFDYMILASATDPDGIQNVLLTPRGKRDSTGNATDRVAARAYNPYVAATRTSSVSSQTTEPNSPALAQPAATGDAANPLIPLSNLPDQPVLTKAAAQMNRSGLTTAGALSPPVSLDRQSIEQQLQQMYQQRSQMMRVINPTNSVTSSPTKQ